MQYHLITTFNQAGYLKYGATMIDTFSKKLLRDNIKLTVYAEHCVPDLADHVSLRMIPGDCKEFKDFLHRHRNNDLAHGRAGPPDVYKPNKQFRWDAVRFSWKVFATKMAFQEFTPDWLIWVDADTLVHTQTPDNFMSQVCIEDQDITYLGRGERYHPECGWVAYNLKRGNAQRFITRFVDLYEKDAIFNLPEWHDSYVWGHLKKQMPDIKFYNLNPRPDLKGFAGHPFINSPLGAYMDHMKGKRKDQGHSDALDIAAHHDNKYWNQIRHDQKKYLRIKKNVTD